MRYNSKDVLENKLKKFSLLSFLIIPVLFFSCKSTPVANQVGALDLLEPESDFYISIPSSVDPSLITYVLENNIPNLSEKNSKLITEKIKDVYLGITKTKRTTEIQATVSADIPVKFAEKEIIKSGWEKREYLPDGSKTKYNLLNSKNPDTQDLTLCFPSSSIVCIGKDVTSKVNYYDYLANTADELPFNQSKLDDELFIFLSGAKETNEIRFYSAKPHAFLSLLIGANLDLRLLSVSGSFIVDPEFTDQYLLKIQFDFKNQKFLKAGKALLSLAFGLTSSQTQVEENSLIISDIHISKEQVIKIININ